MTGQSWSSFSGFRSHIQIFVEHLGQKSVFRNVNQLQQISWKTITIFFQESSRVVEYLKFWDEVIIFFVAGKFKYFENNNYHSSKMIQSENWHHIRFWFQIISIIWMSPMKFIQHRLITSFGKFWLFIDKWHQIQWSNCNQVQGFLIIYKFWK